MRGSCWRHQAHLGRASSTWRKVGAQWDDRLWRFGLVGAWTRHAGGHRAVWGALPGPSRDSATRSRPAASRRTCRGPREESEMTEHRAPCLAETCSPPAWSRCSHSPRRSTYHVHKEYKSINCLDVALTDWYLETFKDDHQFSAGCYLLTVSNSGLLSAIWH